MKFNIKLYDNAEYSPAGWIEDRHERRKRGEMISENPLDRRTLDEVDFIDTIKYLMRLKKGHGAVDDIDHLGNRRVRASANFTKTSFASG